MRLSFLGPPVGSADPFFSLVIPNGVSLAAQPAHPVRRGRPRMQRPAGDERRARGHPGAHRGAHVATHAGLDRLVAAVGVEAFEVEAEVLRAAPLMRVARPVLVAEKRAVHALKRARANRPLVVRGKLAGLGVFGD